MIESEKQKFFLENGYLIIRECIPNWLANMMYKMTLKKADRLSEKLSTPFFKYYQKKLDGHIGDDFKHHMGNQLNSMEDCFNFYGDEFCDTLLEELLEDMEKYTNKKLVCTYSYLRLYQLGNFLPEHIDRDSCEFSITMCLGYNTSNIIDNSNYCWPIVLRKKDKNICVELKPGDMLIYKGIELSHYRDKFLGNNHAQLFLHYNDINNIKLNKFDGRRNLGLPKIIKG